MKFFSKWIMALLCCCSTPLVLHAQQDAQDHTHSQDGYDHECRTELTPSVIRYMNATDRARQAFQDNGRTGTLYIPVRQIIVRETDGSGGITNADLQTAMDRLNAAYAIVDIQFFECSRAYVNNSTYFDLDPNTEEAPLAAAYEISNVVNVFYCNTVGGGCGYADFPGTGDRIFIKNSCARNESSLTHEFGHYFSLYHTHETAFGDELVDGSNCDNAGDKVCDTDADPRLSSGLVNGACVYTGNATDANGDAYTPDPRNIMSYSAKPCRTQFSPGQIARLRYSAINDRGYLTCSCFNYDYVGAFNFGTTFLGNNYTTSGNVYTMAAYNCDGDPNQLRLGNCDANNSVSVDFDVSPGTDKLRLRIRGGWQNGTAQILIDGAYQKDLTLANGCNYTYVYLYNISNYTQDGSVTITIKDADAGCAGDINLDYMSVSAARCHQSSYAKLPYFTNFNSGVLDDYWLLQSTNEHGRARLTNLNGPYSGAYHLVMDSRTSREYATNQSDLRVDLSTCANVALYFRWKEFLDEDHAEDGVYLSDDGGENFTKIYSLTGGTNNTWAGVTLDIDQLASDNGLNLTEECIIRFQQRDNFSATTDGIAIDYISVYGCNNTPMPMLADINNDRALGEVRSVYRGSNQFSDDPQGQVTSLSQLDNNVALTIYPNPANDILNVQFEAFETDQDLTIQVVDLLGRVQYSSNHRIRSSSQDIIQLQVEQLPAGVYTVVIKDQHRVVAHQQAILQR